ncbi:hypothetical protein [Rhodobacter sp. 24-YEA-8]|uniref:hypothetical protein n=1 Tax=Rhodobacter sp. 24-YEA-8 TaxID=1884310 RepID=UPI000899D3F6|nr:hypothetical protein [Rhodobacter sp. 24-YEA-8]SEB53943.1 hypothetical protein SAMN05519105_0684 [Rhodobacter sp. 24-YEA-8]
MRFLDFTSWQTLLATVASLLLVTLIGVGIRIVMMLTIQQRQQRMNRQINERLKVLIAAYKVLGGSFTGTLTVDPTHLRDLRARLEAEGAEAEVINSSASRLERTRVVRDAVEAALSDIILLGTKEQVRLAAAAAADMAAGRPVPTAELVISLRAYIRAALDLEPVPADVVIPAQGPTRGGAAAGKSGGRGGDGGGSGGGGGGMGGGGGIGGGGMGMGPGQREGESS